MVIGIGIDIVDIPRMRKAIGRQKDRFIRRVFSSSEESFCKNHRDPVPHYAARFAAKEALFKALGTGWSQGITWLDAEVKREALGKPHLLLRNEAEKISKSLGVQKIHLSLTHSETAAAAVVVLEK